MSDLIARVRLMIADTNQSSLQFQDQDIQDRLDASRSDVRYENLIMAPSYVNAASTNNVPEIIFADFYSRYQWWESDVVLQGAANNNFWLVLAPVISDYITGHWQFESTPFVNGTYPGQLPPVFATGKVYDPNYAAADLLVYWASALSGAYDVTLDGQNMRRSQLMQQKLSMADYYRRLSKPIIAKMVRDDVMPTLSTRSTPLFDVGDGFKGA